MLKLYRFSGAGNTFVIIDGRNGVEQQLVGYPEKICYICSVNAVDGLMILRESQHTDFKMEYFNRDGSCGMMCGNGGRCIVAFADRLGIRPNDSEYYFDAPDGPHRAKILKRDGDCLTVKLQMKDVKSITPVLDGYFLDTGARHFVKLVKNADDVDVERDGCLYRWNKAFAPDGANVNFISLDENGFLKVRTFEKGVEGETQACGTGITASAITAYSCGIMNGERQDGSQHYTVLARKDVLEVDFLPCPKNAFSEIYLTGPAIMEESLLDWE